MDKFVDGFLRVFVMVSLIGLIVLLFTFNAQADLYVHTLYKYGPNGYVASGNQSTVSTGKHKSSSVNTLDVHDRIQGTFGFGLQNIDSSGRSFGIGYYLDNTFYGSIGARLF